MNVSGLAMSNAGPRHFAIRASAGAPSHSSPCRAARASTTSKPTLCLCPRTSRPGCAQTNNELHLLMLAGPHPRSRSLGGFAPRSGRRRFLMLAGPTPARVRSAASRRAQAAGALDARGATPARVRSAASRRARAGASWLAGPPPLAFSAVRARSGRRRFLMLAGPHPARVRRRQSASLLRFLLFSTLPFLMTSGLGRRTWQRHDRLRPPALPPRPSRDDVARSSCRRR